MLRRIGTFPCTATTAANASSIVGGVSPQQPLIPLFGFVVPLSATPSEIMSSSQQQQLTSRSCAFFTPSSSTTPAVIDSQRFLRVAKSTMGYHIRRRGQFASHWPLFRKPHNQHPSSAAVVPIFHWKRYGPRDPNEFLPKHNYVHGNWVGLTYSNLHQVYTLQHCNAGVPLRVRRFPTIFEFKSHSRWMIGKALRTWVEPKAHIFDEAALTKKARLDLVKKGLLPPGG